MPRFKHDCTQCVDLGEFEEHDLYYCERQGTSHVPTVIARYGNEGDEYLSGMPFVGKVPELTEAHKRAGERGLLK